MAPATFNELAGTVAVSWVGLNVSGVSWVPPNSMTELVKKFAPVTVSVNPPDPTGAFAGPMLLTDGFGVVAMEATMKGVLADCPAGVTTVRVGVPSVATKEDGMDTVTWLILTKLAGSAVV